MDASDASTDLAPTLHMHAGGAVTYAGPMGWDPEPWNAFGNDVILAVPA